MTQKSDLDAIQLKIAETKAQLDKQIDEVVAIKKAYEEKASSFISGGAPTIMTSANMSNSYEKQLMSKFGCRGLPDLLKCDTSLYDHCSIDERMAVMNIKKHFQIARWISQVCYGAPLDKSDGIMEIKDASGKPAGWNLMGGVKIPHILESYYAKQHIIPLIKSFDSGTAVDGGNWVPTILATNFIPEFEHSKLPVFSMSE